MENITLLALILPLAGFLGLVAFGKIIGKREAGIVASTTVLVSFSLFCSLIIIHGEGSHEAEHFTLFSFIPLQGLQGNFTLHIDSLSLLMTLIITGIGFLIHVYSVGYMSEDEGVIRYFAFLNFFIFAMLLLVLAGDLLVLFLGWEGVGLASYFLIGFYYTRPEAAAAAVKAFVMNRIGDLAFLIALILTFNLFGTSDIAEILKRVGREFAVGAPVITLLTLLYFIGATGKSAQLPLYTWLPDAMAGPTPVSALIHAATMVTAGVYLLVRLHPLFIHAPDTLQVIGVVGGATTFFASLCALGQTDLKRVLAFSTVSQLGLMFVACGAGAFYSAMFHLTMHAFIKALLFLSAGNVVHMLHGVTDMRKMGGLSKIFKKTHWLFLVGALSLSGVPPLAAFFSKDLVLEQEYLSGHDFLFTLSLIASILTGVYMMRAYCLTFLGPQSLSSQEAIKVHEAPSIMLLPLAVLAFFSIFGGLLGYTFDQVPLLSGFLGDLQLTSAERELHSGFVLTAETWVAVGGALLGVGVTTYVYTQYRDQLGTTLPILREQFYVNECYEWIFVRPLNWLGEIITTVIEPEIFSASMTVVGGAVEKIALKLQLVQSGQVRSSMAWMVVGAALLMTYLLVS